MPENTLKYGEKVFLIAAMTVIIGTCVALILLCG
jgi:hypothetical protein